MIGDKATQTTLVLTAGYVVASAAMWAQTTQAVVAGRVRDAGTGQPLLAVVTYFNQATGETDHVRADSSGFYALPPIAPGTYRLRAEADSYQAQEAQDLEILVAARLDVTFSLRPLADVLDAGSGDIVVLPENDIVLPVLGPDLERGRFVAVRPLPAQQGVLYSTLSYVIDRDLINDLPLTGRDVYAMLAMLPGVTAENATGRGLGLSVNGQRPSSSNYLLDGVENNDYLITGPLAPAAPESIQEYRISTANFSAEFGRAAGFITNAVTLPGTGDWHGLGYFYLANDALDANSFGRNAGLRENAGSFGTPLPRLPRKEDEAGAQAGGPIVPGVLLQSGSLDFFRSRSFAAPGTVGIPAASALDATLAKLGADSAARRLFERFPPPPVASAQPIVSLELSPPVSIDRWLASERVDLLPRTRGHRFMARAALSRRSQPDFIWSPYTDFTSGLETNTTAVAVGWTAAVSRASNELRGSWNITHLQWDRAHPEIPTLLAGDASLPGSPASYAYRNDSRNWELLDNLSVAVGAHVLKAGGGALLRRISGYLTLGSAGQFSFNNLNSVLQDLPSAFSVGVDRQSSGSIPQYDRRYSYRQYHLYVEDSYKATDRLSVSLGVRYENFGAPANIGQVKDYLVRLPDSGGIIEEIRHAAIDFPGPGEEPLYASDGNNWAARFGLAYNLDGKSTTLRGGYGIFYDRPFDNLWENLRNNNVVWKTAVGIGVKTDFLAPVSDLIGRFRYDDATSFLVAYQPGMRDGYVQSYFLGAQRQVGSLLLDCVGSGSSGRKLVTNDILNRAYNELGRSYNPGFPAFSYRSSQGGSSYLALIASARYRTRASQFQLSYTWGHSIDNQSDPLAGEFFNLNFAEGGRPSTNNAMAAFSRQFDSRGDRGNSDFDQRHNLLFFSTWNLPEPGRPSKVAGILRGWKVSELAAVRSGFPYTVFAIVGAAPASGGQLLPNPRADLVDPVAARTYAPVQGGILLLNRDAFRPPPPGVQGNTGRNTFGGPGLFNVDLSVSRSFHPRRLRDSTRLVLRADLYNVLNHSNLNNPVFTTLGGDHFGVALFGRTGRTTGFPPVAPLNETARRVQLMLRLQF